VFKNDSLLCESPLEGAALGFLQELRHFPAQDFQHGDRFLLYGHLLFACRLYGLCKSFSLSLVNLAYGVYQVTDNGREVL
ncbi:hypothetical protein RSW84_29600, partial [Escherichia coli]|uniref:hypothetical protein n=1 Tax=Escherichia coli TaxID=562 RepID=UPI0028DECFBC